MFSIRSGQAKSKLPVSSIIQHTERKSVSQHWNAYSVLRSELQPVISRAQTQLDVSFETNNTSSQSHPPLLLLHLYDFLDFICVCVWFFFFISVCPFVSPSTSHRHQYYCYCSRHNHIRIKLRNVIMSTQKEKKNECFREK